MNNKKETLKISLIAIFLGILLGVVILLVSGKNPFLLFNSFLRGIIGVDLIKGNGVNLRYFGEFIVTSMPIVLTGLSVGFAYRTGLFNIGAEGQLMVGAMTSIVVAILVPMPVSSICFFAERCIRFGFLFISFTTVSTAGLNFKLK